MMVMFEILDVNDNPPVFTEDSYTADVDEDAATGKQVIQVSATDVDEIEDQVITYQIISGNNAGAFSINSGDGSISVAGSLDYETFTDYSLEVLASDGLNYNSATVVIEINNVNDVAPTFVTSEYTWDYTENTDPDDQPVLTVIAIDGDADSDSSEIQYGLAGTGVGDYFDINSDTGEVMVLQELDREFKSSYNLILSATDDNGDGLTGYADLSITVLDVNDNDPYFPDSPYTATVAEDADRGDDVITITPFDSDEDSEFTFSIDSPETSSGEDIFNIDSNDGTIEVNINDGLDRETDDSYEIIVYVDDSGGHTGTGTVYIEVSDVNDSPPVFSELTVSIDVPEDTVRGDVLYQISVDDGDLDESNIETEVTMSSVPTGGTSIFTALFNVDDGSVYIQLEDSSLDYDEGEQQYILTLHLFDDTVVTDSSNTETSTCTVTIVVTDVNDNFPIFMADPYIVTMSEDTPIGTSLLTVTALDIDEDGLQEFTFDVDYEAEEPKMFYVVASDTTTTNTEGQILRVGTVYLGDLLDYEDTEYVYEGQQSSRYISRKVVAIDDGDPAMVGNTTVTVFITDINDNAPVLMYEYNITVYESTTDDELPLELISVEGIDFDSSDHGPPFTFELTGDYADYFDLEQDTDTTAIISQAVVITRSVPAEFDLEITICDNEDADPQMCTVSYIEVDVHQNNDNPHTDTDTEVSIYSLYGSMPASVVGQVHVDDEDENDDSEAGYSMISGEGNGFNVSEISGSIYMIEGLDAGFYYMQVVVYDANDTYPDATATVTIEIIEISSEQLDNAASLRISGVTAEEFITEDDDGDSYKSTLITIISDLSGASEENIDIFSVMDVEKTSTMATYPDIFEDDEVDVYFTAHGSPVYSAEKLEGLIDASLEYLEEELGLDISDVGIDECSDEHCDSGGCTTMVTADSSPTVTSSGGQSFAGVTIETEAYCICTSTDYTSTVTCDDDPCLNGGTCVDIPHSYDPEGYQCECESGYDGPNCELTTMQFEGDGYAWFSAPAICKENIISLDFITKSDSGLIFYVGPMRTIDDDDNSDFFGVELVSKAVRVTMNLGESNYTLQLTIPIDPDNDLTDGNWHNLYITRDGANLDVMIDYCTGATVTEDDDSSSQDDEYCHASGSVDGSKKYLNVDSSLQLGGVIMTEWQGYQMMTQFFFDGCLSEFEIDGFMYDMNDPAYSYNSKTGCSSDEYCFETVDGNYEPLCGDNGDCVASLDGFIECVCDAFYTGDYCDEETTEVSFDEDSYVLYELLMDEIDDYELIIMLSFRTIYQTGVLLSMTSTVGSEYCYIELSQGNVQFRYNLGDGEFTLVLEYTSIDDGYWHTVEVDRYGSLVMLSLDGGGSQNEVSESQSDFMLMDLDRNSLVIGAYVYGDIVSEDFQGCITDVRINSYVIPLLEDNDNAIITESDNVLEDCYDEDDCTGITCPDPQFCYELWRDYDCVCPTGYTTGADEDTCDDIDECADSSYCSHGNCTNYDGGYTCICDSGWSGSTCGTEKLAVAQASLSLIAWLLMLIAVLLLLLLLLVFIVCKRHQDYDEDLLVDPAYDIRENVMTYDDGGGEADQDYNIAPLRKPVDETSPPLPATLLNSAPPPLGKDETDQPDVNSFIKDRLPDADTEADNMNPDTLMVFYYEGQGSEAGTLSSLNTSSSPDFDQFSNWGPPFKRLADMFGEGETESD